MGGDKLAFAEASTYDALSVLRPGSFDMVFTGIGALCWLPSIKRLAEVVAALLKPGGHLSHREGHPILWSVGEENTEELVVSVPYFEPTEPMIWDQGSTSIDVGNKVFRNTKTMGGNGIMEWEKSSKLFLMWGFRSQVWSSIKVFHGKHCRFRWQQAVIVESIRFKL
ncbi:hypothetical protein AC578_2523 [Pseudocercospora eumusae]|uniref:Uncharacterized protein n=1 Tax=Pseudocercospora eumusae TaxID=321146 RepID=A0A139GW09_9PEZI|nr:hypothetical protein AC578_2523 [Pseudocercospora eumusae]KXS94370.1 hypothetical protein AC578_2523 [Pseudocercospora eumusae]